MNPRIHYTKPSITELEVTYATDAARNGWGERCYDYIYRFEPAFESHLGVRHAIATSSCTGALHMGLAALGIGPGRRSDPRRHQLDRHRRADQSIWARRRSSSTSCPTAGASIRDAVEAAITPRTKAILAVHLYGNLCDMDALLAIGERHGIPVVEDAAEAIGSEWHGRRAGSMGAFGSFSFHGTKTLTTGEGGMFVTNDDALYETVLTLSNHGRARGQTRQFWPDMVGFKYKMSNVQAAIGCAQIERIEELVSRKREILRRYRELLEGCVGVAMNPEPPGTVNGAWMPTVVFAPETGVTRERLQAMFAADNVDARVFFHPLSSLPMFGSHVGGRLSADIVQRAINLPSYHDMTDEEQQRVTALVRNALAA